MEMYRSAKQINRRKIDSINGPIALALDQPQTPNTASDRRVLAKRDAMERSTEKTSESIPKPPIRSTSVSPAPVRKRVTLTFETGSVSQGFSITLQIGLENQLPQIVVAAALPANANLQEQFSQWERSYNHLSRAGRPIGLPKVQTPSTREACEAAALALRQGFNQWFRQPEVSPLRDAWLTHLKGSEEIRIVLQSESQIIQRMPWHHWDLLERLPQAEVALAARSFDQLSATIQPVSPLPILAVLGDSEGIDIDSDRQALMALPQTDIKFLVEPRRAQLTDKLWEQPWPILFFAGHSCSEEEGGKLSINTDETLRLQELKFGLKRAVSQGLQLAIFNSCDGLGLAREFADLNIPQLIIMREPVPDRVAQTFLKYFLRAYMRGTPLYLAVREARERLQALEDEFPCATWLPMIFQHPAAQPPTWQELMAGSEPTPDRAEKPETFSSVSAASPNPATPVAATPSPTTVSSQLPANNAPMVRYQRRRLFRQLGLSTAIAAGLLGIRHLGLLQPLELKTFDQLIQLRPEEPPESRILLIKVTEEDLAVQADRAADESLSDPSLNQMLSILEQHQPAVIGLDIYRNNRFSPVEALGDRLRTQDNLIATCRVSQDNDIGFAPPPEVPPGRLGFSDSLPDGDGIQRRQLLTMTIPADSPCPGRWSLSTLLALQYLNGYDIGISNPTSSELYLGDRAIPLIRNHNGPYQAAEPWGYQTLLNYRAHKGGLQESIAHQLTLRQVLNEEFLPEVIQDKIILVGTTAESFGDYSPTPYNPQTPGVLIQAQMISQLISTALDSRPMLWIPARRIEAVWIVSAALSGGLLGYWVRGRRTPTWVWFSLGGLLLLQGGICFIALVQWGALLPLLPASLGLLASSFLGFRSHAPPSLASTNSTQTRSKLRPDPIRPDR